MANLKEIIDRSQYWGILEVTLQTNHPTLRDEIMANGESYEENNQRYNELIRMVAREKKVILVDIHDKFMKVLKQNLNVKPNGLLLPYPDLLHLSENGNRLYFEFMKEEIEKAVERVVTGNRNGLR